MEKEVSKKPNLDELVNGIQDLVYVTDPKRRIIYANSAFANIFRYPTPNDLIGKSISSLYVNREHRRLLEQSMRERGGRVINYFVYVERLTGERFYLSVDSNWIDNDANKGIEGTGRDLTELIDFIGPFFQLNLDGVLTFCSLSFALLFGFVGPELVIGKNIQDLLTETQPFVEICEQVLSKSDNQRSLKAKRYMHASASSPILIKLNVSRIVQIVNDHKEIVGYQGMFEDVTAVEEARIELEEYHSILKLLTEKSEDAIYVIQGEKLKFVNPTFCNMVEHAENELLEMPYLELIHPDDRKEVDIKVRRKLAREEMPAYNFRIVSKTGKERIVRASSGYCTVRKVDSVYGYLRDITDELHHEEELTRKIEEHTHSLKEALEDKRVLLDTVVHEMDAPIVAIRGTTERLIAGIGTEAMAIPRQLTKLGDINDLCQLVFMMVRNVSLAESEVLGRAKEIKCLHLERDLITKAMNFMKPLLRNKGLPVDRMEIHLRGTPPYIRVNDDLFLQVFFNLFSNSVKYSKADTNAFRIEITSDYSTSRNLVLRFSDWGIGIPEGESLMIFDKRKRGSNARNSLGMGLGLWVARKILKTYKCDIWVDNLFEPTTLAIRVPSNLLTDKISEGGTE